MTPSATYTGVDRKEKFFVPPARRDPAELEAIDKQVDDIVSYHAPDQDAIDRMGILRANAASMIKAIMFNCPPSADRSAAIRKVREALFTGNCAISLNGKGL